MEGENNGNREAPRALPDSAAISSPDAQNRKHVNEDQRHISDQALVDRIKKSDRWMIGLTGAIVATGIISAIISRAQQDAMQGQLDAMEADQRPWVTVVPGDGIGLVAPLTFDPKGASAKIQYKLRNTGKSPALHVRFRAKIVFLPEKTFADDEIVRAQDDLCNPLRSIKNAFSDEMIVPGDDGTARPYPMAASAADIADALLTKESGPFKHPGFVTPYVIACIDYQPSPKSSEHFQMRYAFLLGIPQDNGAIMGDIKPEGVQSDVRLVFFSQSAE
ncbi:MAG: hypothetical protein JO223_25290 [Hyphomicrobiales bacterium]|nr:hypothetical protein [Hyphomicrobiales bacterium]